MASHNLLTAIEKLKGRENYNTWKFAMEIYLEHEGLSECIDGTETDAKKLSKAKTSLILSIDKINYVHVQDATSAKDIWEKLKATFDDSGLGRRVCLLRTLIQTNIQNCASMEEYVSQIVTTAHKLNSIGLKVTDEWVGTFLLAGLNDEYRPMIMAIENSGVGITGDSIKTRLLQEVKGGDGESAFFNQNRSFKKKSGKKSKAIHCYECKEPGHKSNVCPKKGEAGGDKNKKRNENTTEKTKVTPAFSAVFLCGKYNVNDWYIDSGASCHMSLREDWFDELTASSISEITAANSSRMKVAGVGDIELVVQQNGGVRAIKTRNVLCVPDLMANLLSVSKIVESGNTIKFVPTGCQIFDCNSKMIATATLVNNLYRLDAVSGTCMIAAPRSVEIDVWHRRMGHVNYGDLIKMKNGAVDGVDFVNGSSDQDACVACLKGKQARKPFPPSDSRAANVLDLVHGDLCGPMSTTSIGGALYVLVLVDDFSRMVFTYFLKTKFEVFDAFVKFRNQVENQTERRIKIFRSDNGTEFCNKRMQSEFDRCGIVHQTSNTYTPQQNGLAERTIRTITEKARCMLYDADFDKTYWSEAMNTATYIKNRSVSRVLSGKSPVEMWTGLKPNVSHFRIFGAKAMVHTPKEKRLKLDPKSKAYRLVGYCENTKGYRLIDPTTNTVIKSRDVVFFENSSMKSESKESGRLNDCVVLDFDAVVNPEVNDEHGDPNDNEDDEFDDAIDDNERDNDEQDDHNGSQTGNSSDDSSEEPVADNLRNDPNYVPPGGANALNLDPNAVIRRTSRRPIRRQFPDFVTYMTGDDDSVDPVSVKQAMISNNREDWKVAMCDEYDSLIENQTWSLVDLPNGRKPINNKWVFKTKTDSDGKIMRFKARLVAKGCSQREGIDYDETFSPVVRYASIRFLVSLAAKLNLDVEQMDAVTAFLQGDIEEEIYMKQPECFDDQSGRVCLLKKAVYGLKQASRQWNIKLNEVLLRSGYTRSAMDPCIYSRTENQSLVYVAVYVDDLLIFSNNNDWKETLKDDLKRNFKMKDLGQANSCVGIRITRNRNEGKIFLDQKKYIEEILAKFRMQDCNPVKTPSDPNQKLTKTMSPQSDEEANEMSNVPYQEAVGSILYLAQCTRPDISFAIANVSKFNQNPGRAHWNAVKRIFRYLKGTMDYKLEYSAGANSNIIGYSDADWAADTDDRKSCTGYVFKLQGGAISWASKKQHTVALSSTEAEYMALAAACQEAAWLRQLKKTLEASTKDEPTTIYCDNRSALNLANMDAYRVRTKHIDIRHHFVRNKVIEGEVRVEPIDTKQMVADSLTKAVLGDKQKYCAVGMGLN